jgi:predicted hydrolase (HD superfamily)
VREHLVTLGVVLRTLLQRELAQLGPRWWHDGVLHKLSYQQRTTAEENDWSTLADLEVGSS